MILVAEIGETLGTVSVPTDGVAGAVPAVTPPATAYSTIDASGRKTVAVETAGVDVGDALASTDGWVVVDVDWVDTDTGDVEVDTVGVG